LLFSISNRLAEILKFKMVSCIHALFLNTSVNKFLTTFLLYFIPLFPRADHILKAFMRTRCESMFSEPRRSVICSLYTKQYWQRCTPFLDDVIAL